MLRSFGRVRSRLDNSFELIAVAVGLFTLIFVMLQTALGATPAQKTFATPEEAVKALIEAAKAKESKPILDILGPEAKSFIDSGDPVSDRESRERFIKAYQESNALKKESETKVTLEVGKDKWPFPIPIVKESAGWRFDTKAGREEIVNRRIGRNELDVMEVCLAYVDAQREYYQRNPQKDPLRHYAQKFLSAQGKRDGLYWEAKTDEPPSPLGPLVVQAKGEGYRATAGKPTPYHGYHYKILTGQGADAPGGAYDYLVRGKMVGGFAMVAYPAQYGSSGIMTFIVNHDGVVYEKDLGPNTAGAAGSMTRFNPDKTWKQAKKS